ncbi:MAG: ABC transporter ATP-binding protein [Candidatus Hodarchaeales archaeon]|jgi:putative ABC transport system ATP-binding protein
MNYILELEDVTKIFGSDQTLVHAVNEISIKFKEREFVALLGKSGCGKSTFVSLLAGLEPPTTGKIIFKENEISSKSEDELSLFRRKNVGIIFQHFNLLSTMTALENVELPLLIQGYDPVERKEKAIKVLQKLGLEDKMYNLPEELSGGEKQRVGIARALINQPKIILADEPTGDLDSETGDIIIKLLSEINQNNNSFILIVTHDESKLRSGMRKLVMKDGFIIEDSMVED